MPRWLIAAIAIAIASCSAPQQPQKHERRRGLSRDGQCGTTRPPGKADPQIEEGCRSDAECKDGKNGRCNTRSAGPTEDNVCEYDRCFADSECSHGICYCDDRGNECLPANCKRDADCGGNMRCLKTFGCNHSLEGMYCQSPQDTCATDEDCRQLGQDGECVYRVSIGARACVDLRCPVG